MVPLDNHKGLVMDSDAHRIILVWWSLKSYTRVPYDLRAPKLPVPFRAMVSLGWRPVKMYKTHWKLLALSTARKTPQGTSTWNRYNRLHIHQISNYYIYFVFIIHIMLVGFDKYTHRMRFVPVGYIYKVGAGALTRGIDLGGAITPNDSHQRTRVYE